jgi:hypothetical protein
MTPVQLVTENNSPWGTPFGVGCGQPVEWKINFTAILRLSRTCNNKREPTLPEKI